MYEQQHHAMPLACDGFISRKTDSKVVSRRHHRMRNLAFHPKVIAAP